MLEKGWPDALCDAEGERIRPRYVCQNGQRKERVMRFRDLKTAAEQADINRVPPKYPSSAGEAVDCRNAALRSLSALVKTLEESPRLASAYEQETGLDIQSKREWIGMIDRSEVFWFTKYTAESISAASQSFPIEPPLFMPTLRNALAVFDGDYLSAEISGIHAPFSAMLWSTAIRARDNAPFVQVVGFQWRPPVCNAVWWSSIIHPINHIVDQNDPSFRDEQIALLRWLMSASMFVEQKLAVPEPCDIPRGVRRSAERNGIHLPKVSVVRLRRVGSQRDIDSIAQQEWSCRWLVTGHWRNQWYQKAGRHVRRWIAPYVKGPEDKPMKPPTPRVFAVKR
jgi:hypothetical protein